MNVRYRVELSEAERSELTALLRGGRHAARTFKRAQILLAADAGDSEEAIARRVAVSAATVGRTKRRFVEGNLERALYEEPRPGAARLLSGREEALLVATACATPPAGRARWTLELLAGEVVRLTGHDSLSRETPELVEGAPAPGRKRPRAVAREDVVHPAGGRRIRRPHGGCARSRSLSSGRAKRGPVGRTTGSEFPGGVL